MAPAVRLITISMPQSNAFLLKGEKTVLVDTGVPGSQERILGRLKKAGIKPEELALIFLTHGHIDHRGSAKALRELTGAKVAIHQADADMARGLDVRPPKPATPLGQMAALAMRGARKSPEAIFEPDITFSGGFDLRPYGVAAQAIHTPGHTDGSTTVVLQGGEAIVGDLVMADFPRMRTPGLPIFVEDMRQLRASVALVLSLNPTLIYCAHGGPFKPEAVRRQFGL